MELNSYRRNPHCETMEVNTLLDVDKTVVLTSNETLDSRDHITDTTCTNDVRNVTKPLLRHTNVAEYANIPTSQGQTRVRNEVTSGAPNSGKRNGSAMCGSEDNASVVDGSAADPETGSKGGGEERETWGKKVDFLLSVIGFAVDLGNVWRFPYICYRNGGGAFLIPYFTMLVFLGLPLFYMELALGQYHRSGAISIWQKLCPMFTGAGFGICLVAAYVGMYYNTIIAWALYYLVASFRSKLPWASCNNSWNTPNCISISEGYNRSLVTIYSAPSALEYFHYNVLESHRSTGIGDIGSVKWTLCLCLLVVMATVYFALWKGVKSSGKVVWVTATVPYVVLIVLLIRGVTLPGAGEGIRYYVTPVWGRLFEVGVWLDAAAQIFFSLGPGFGTLLALSSYNKFNNNCYLDAMCVGSINCLTSLLAGFVVFSILGYMSHVLQVPIKDLAVQGPGLVFYVYPEAISTLSGSVFWAIIFFVLLITLGLDSTFGGLESVITAICDLSPRLARRRELVVLAVVSVCFLGSVPTTTYGGQYVITLMDTHAAPVALIFICFIEAIAVNWFYGVQRFSDDIEKMLGFQPGIYWKICWAGICPLFLLILFVLSIVAYEGLSLEGYVFPVWSEVVGWMITGSSLVCIPCYLVYATMNTPGDLKMKLCRIAQPLSDAIDNTHHTGFVVGFKSLYHSLNKHGFHISNPFYRTNNVPPVVTGNDETQPVYNNGNDVTANVNSDRIRNGGHVGFVVSNLTYDTDSYLAESIVSSKGANPETRVLTNADKYNELVDADMTATHASETECMVKIVDNDGGTKPGNMRQAEKNYQSQSSITNVDDDIDLNSSDRNTSANRQTFVTRNFENNYDRDREMVLKGNDTRQASYKRDEETWQGDIHHSNG